MKLEMGGVERGTMEKKKQNLKKKENQMVSET